MEYFQSVLAFGDSHVAGCELSNTYSLDQYLSGKITLEQADLQGKNFAFPQLVADALGVPCYNYALTGGSNTRSIRKLIQAVKDHPDSLVLFGYTCTDRYEFYYPSDGNFLGRDDDNYIQVGMQWQGSIQTMLKYDSIKHPINDIFIKKFLYEKNNLDDLMFCVDSISSKHSKKFFHIPLFPENYTTIYNVINFENCKNYVSWCEANKFSKLPFLHYGHDAHIALAKLILKEI